MSTNSNIPGASKNNPATDANAPRKTKRTPALASNAAVTQAGAAAPAGRDVLLAEQAAVQSALGLLDRVAEILGPYVQPLTTGDAAHKGRVTVANEALIPLTADLLRNEPVLATVTSADELDAGVVVVGDLRQLASKLQGTLTDVQRTARVASIANWNKARLTITIGEHMARKDGHMQTMMAPITQARKRGSRVATTAAAAHASQDKVTRSQRKLTRSQQQAALAQERADAAKRAQTLAEAQRTGAMPPAPVTGTGTPHTG